MSRCGVKRPYVRCCSVKSIAEGGKKIIDVRIEKLGQGKQHVRNIKIDPGVWIISLFQAFFPLRKRLKSPTTTASFSSSVVYWGARGRWRDPDTNQEYITARRLSDRSTSRTLATCFCYNRYDAVGPTGPWPTWYASHVQGQFLWDQGVPFDPKPDGLVVGYLDGACRFVKWNDLSPSNHAGQYIVYYDPTY